MYGSILGDIVGSRFEFSKPKGFRASKVPLFAENCFFTDDSVMTIATRYALLNRVPYGRAYEKFGKRYPLAGYGTMFQSWLKSYPKQAYNSYGNGAAMRIGFLGWHFSTLEEVEKEAAKSAMCTHNHPEGIKGAVTAAGCVFLARTGASKREIRHYVQRQNGYNLNPPLVFRRPFTKFDISCQGSIPLAVRCFLESDSWESCMRNVLSVTCDTDTICCIAGAIADAYYQGTGYDELELLERYLVSVNMKGERDTFLFDWATCAHA